MSEVVFFMLIGVACSISSLSMAVFGSWLAGDAGCVWITSISFVAGYFGRFDVIVIDFTGYVVDVGCGGGGGDDDGAICSWKLSVAVAVRISLPASTVFTKKIIVYSLVLLTDDFFNKCYFFLENIFINEIFNETL